MLSYLEGVPSPGETGCQEISVGNDEERQKNSQRQQPDEGPPSTVTAVALVTGRANQGDEKEAKNRTDT